jgi:hypothetical protein
MKTKDVEIWGISLKVTFWQHETDHFNPVDGHYTLSSKWHIDSIEHAGVDISEIVSDEIWQRIEREANNG